MAYDTSCWIYGEDRPLFRDYTFITPVHLEEMKWRPPIYTIQRRREKTLLGGTPSNRAYARYRHFGEAERNYHIFEKRWEPTEGGRWVVYQLNTLRENNWTKSSKKNQWKLPNPIFHTASEVMQTKLLLRAQESSDSPPPHISYWPDIPLSRWKGWSPTLSVFRDEHPKPKAFFSVALRHQQLA